MNCLESRMGSEEKLHKVQKSCKKLGFCGVNWANIEVGDIFQCQYYFNVMSYTFDDKFGFDVIARLFVIILFHPTSINVKITYKN